MTDPLPRKPLFDGGPEVSRLCLGTMMFGDQSDEAESGRILDGFLAAGGNFVDTADAYVGGESERILGRLLEGRREEVILATKLGNPVTGVDGSGGISAAWIARAAEDSLDRMRTDVIDLYYLHRDDDVTPIGESVAAMGALIAAGKVRHWGFSNFRSWKIAEMVRVADTLGVPRPVVAQPYYHMLNRVAETDLLPACAHFGIGVVPYSPLARGVLTGKYRDGSPEGSRAARGDARMLETEFHPETVAAANLSADHAAATGRDPAALAVQWVLANKAVSSVLIGPKSVEQLQGYLAAMPVAFTEADERALSAICASGHTPAPGYSDPRYPLRGRMTAFG